MAALLPSVTAIRKRSFYSIKWLLCGLFCSLLYIYSVINDFNPTFEVQNMGNKAFQNVSFPNEKETTVASGLCLRYPTQKGKINK